MNAKMELSQEEEIPMPLNSVYGGVHALAHHHLSYNHHDHQDQPSSTTSLDNHHTNDMPIPITTMLSNTNDYGKTNTTTTTTLEYHEEEQQNDGEVSYNNKDTTNNPTISIRYKECQKNHAASIGGKALDGCGEFMPSGDEGTIEALICCACNCHRNFHRKEIDGHNHNHNQYQYPYPHHFYLPSPHPHPRHIVSTRGGRKVMLGSGNSSGGGGNSSSGGFLGYPTSVRALPLNVSYQVGLGGPVASSDEQEHEDDHGGGGGGGSVVVMRPPHQMVKRRVRTKFSQEQKEKMLEFAEKVGWKIQKQEDSVVQQFCQEIGIKRRVLKIWMHNNKHTFAKKCIDNNNPNTNNNFLTTSNLLN